MENRGIGIEGLHHPKALIISPMLREDLLTRGPMRPALNEPMLGT